MIDPVTEREAEDYPWMAWLLTLCAGGIAAVAALDPRRFTVGSSAVVVTATCYFWYARWVVYRRRGRE